MHELYNEFDFFPSFKVSHYPRIAAAALGAGIAATAGLIASAYNNYQTNKTNKENQEWTSEENEKTREAEAHALQTRTEDAVNAGFSPLAALDTGAAQVSSPLQYRGDAAQMDFSSMIGAVSDAGMTISNQYAQEKLQKEQLKDNSKNRDSQYQIAQLQCQSQKDIASANIASAEQMADDANRLKWIEMNQNYSVAQNNLQALLSRQDTDVAKANADILHQQNQETIKSMDAWAQTMHLHVNYKYYDCSTEQGLQEYNTAMSYFQSQLQTGFHNMSAWYNSASPEERAQLWSKSTNESRNNGFGLNSKIQDLPISGGLNVSIGSGSGDSETSQMREDVQAMQANKWFGLLVMPLKSVGSGSYYPKSNWYSTPNDWH